MISQGILPQAVLQGAAAGQLGAFTKVYKVSSGKAIAGSIILTIVAVSSIAFGLLPPDLAVMTRVIVLLFGLLFLAGAISQISSIIQTANQQIYLFQQGIIIDKGKQVQVLPWNQIAEVWQNITRHYRNGSYTGTTYLYTLRRADGYQIKLDDLTKDIAELGVAIVQGSTRELLPRALHALRAGQTLTFASFSVNQSGISNGQEHLTWSQVQAVDVHQGYMIVKKTGISQIWRKAHVAKIPNLLVFTAITAEMIRQAGSKK
jgi:hypothetical protein